MDVARTAIRNGSKYVTCFSVEEGVAASDYEFRYASLEGVKFRYCLKPVEIVDEGVIFRKLAIDENQNTVEVEGSDKLYKADSVIISISQKPRNSIASKTEGLEANKNGLMVVDEFGHTGREGIFASGDVVHGARTVVEAVAHSKIVAEAMHNYIQGC